MDVQQAINEAIAQIATNYGAEYAKEIKAAISKLDKVASGALYKSVNYDVNIQETGVHLDLIYLQYLNWINSGRKPGTQPPVDSILKWIQLRRVPVNANARRNAIGRFSKGFKFRQGRNRAGQFTSILKQQTSLAWAISKSIKKKGIKAVPILDEVNAKLYAPMQKEAADAAGAVAASMLGGMFREEYKKAGFILTQ